jgi:hypothetical protein
VRRAGGRHGERTLRGACVHRESQIRSGRAWARIGQQGDVARAQAEWAVHGVRQAGRATIGGGDGGMGKRRCGVGGAGCGKWACGVFEAAQAGPRDDVARVPVGWAACTGHGGVDGAGVDVRCQRPSWTDPGQR